jgi:hypothetical protein
MRGFVGMDLHPCTKTLCVGTPDLSREPAPDETAACRFRHLLKRHGLGKQMLAMVNGYLERHGLKIGTGTIVDATILAAPSSTKNKQQQRDPEMRQVKKGNRLFSTCAPTNLLTVQREAGSDAVVAELRKDLPSAQILLLSILSGKQDGNVLQRNWM